MSAASSQRLQANLFKWPLRPARYRGLLVIYSYSRAGVHSIAVEIISIFFTLVRFLAFVGKLTAVAEAISNASEYGLGHDVVHENCSIC